MFFYTDDPVADFDRWDAEQHRRLKRRPRCAHCDEYIQSHYDRIDADTLCPDCLESDYRVDADDYLDL